MNATFGVNITNLTKLLMFMQQQLPLKTLLGRQFSQAELQKYTAAVNKAEGSLKQASKFLNILGETGQGKFLLSTLFKQFFNTYIRQGKSIPNVNRVIQEFSGYYRTLLQKEIDLKKTVTAKNKYVKIQEDGNSSLLSQINMRLFTSPLRRIVIYSQLKVSLSRNWRRLKRLEHSSARILGIKLLRQKDSLRLGLVRHSNWLIVLNSPEQTSPQQRTGTKPSRVQRRREINNIL